MTMTLVQKIDVPLAGQAVIEFTGIPQTGKDLFVLLSCRTNADELGSVGAVRINGDTSSSYVSRRLLGEGTGVSSDTFTGAFLYRLVKWDGSTDTASTFGNTQLYIPNYTSSVAKTLSSDSVVERAGTNGAVQIGTGRWTGTAAITSLSFSAASGGSFVQYSSASLYTISTTGATGATVA